MDKFTIEGITPLKGEIEISGSKNAALPLMAAALVADKPVTLKNIPKLNDIYTFSNVMRVTGARVDFDEDSRSMVIDPTNISYLEAPYELVRKMRASFYMTGALLGRAGRAKVSLPGGCAWGPRPVNLHIEGLKAFGAHIDMEAGYVNAAIPGDRLPGGHFELSPSSVGATINLLLAACKAAGTCIISNAAMEPDVVQLCDMLTKMGAQIEGAGTSKITVHGVDSLKGIEYYNAPDRIETGTFMIAGLMHPDSELTLTNCAPEDLGVFRDVIAETGGAIAYDNDKIHIKAPDIIRPVSIKTEIYPGFPTDLQAQWATMMTLAGGDSTVTDTIYPDRFSYVPELARLGADISVKNNTAYIKGKAKLVGASVMSTDLRASVSLVMAAMNSRGTSDVLRVYHLDRGYEDLENKLNNVGASVKRVAEQA